MLFYNNFLYIVPLDTRISVVKKGDLNCLLIVILVTIPINRQSISFYLLGTEALKRILDESDVQ